MMRSMRALLTGALRRVSSARDIAGALVLLLAAGPAAAQQDTVVARPDTTQQADTARRVEEHAQDSPDDRGYVIRTSDGRYRLRLLGSLRTLATFDLEGLPSTEGFSPIEIPVPDEGANNNRFTMEARQSRLGFEATAPVGKRENGDARREVFARIETDFRGSDNSLRLRHAYVRIGQEWIVGQTWTTFTDATALPLTVDLDGPNSAVTLRSVQFRVSRPWKESWRWAVALESPAADVTVAQEDDAVVAYQNVPDVIAHVRKVTPTVRLQVSGVFRVISVKDSVDGKTGKIALGGMVSLRQRLNDTYVLGAQGIVGKGISRYISGFSGRGLDLVQDPETGEYETLGEAGGYLSLSREWEGKSSTSLILGTLWALDDFLPDDFYRAGGYLALNHFLSVGAGARMGLEAVVGTRRNVDGQRGNAARVQALFMYDF